MASLNIKNQAIGRKLLTASNLNDMSWFDISPSDRNEFLDLDSNHQELQHLVVNFVGDLPLSQLEGDVPYGHQAHVHYQSRDRKRFRNRVLSFGVDDQYEEQCRQEVFEVVNAIDYEVPHSDDTLIPVSVNLVRILNLVCNQLVPLAAFELHLLLEILVFVGVLASLIVPVDIFIFSKPLLIVLLRGQTRVVKWLKADCVDFHLLLLL